MGKQRPSEKKDHSVRFLTRETIPLEVQLSEDERIEAGKSLGEALQEIDELTLDLSAIRKQYKAKIDKVKMEVSRLKHMVNKGAEKKLVECEWQTSQDPDEDDVKYLVRTDTGEIIGRDVMTDEDLQRSLDMGLPDPPAPAVEDK